MDDKNLETSRDTTINSLVAFILADIDIFLLKEEDQETDKDKLYSAEEIRSQLIKSRDKMLSIFDKSGLNTEAPLGRCIGIYNLFSNGSISNNEVINARKDFLNTLREESTKE